MKTRPMKTRPMKTSRVLAFGSIAAVVVACGGTQHSVTPASPKLNQACDAIGAKIHECQPKRDIAEFKADCTSKDIFRFFDSVHPDEVSNQVFACFTASACEAKFGESVGPCEAEAVKSIPLSPRAKTLCDKLEHTYSDCSRSGGSAFKTPCNVEMRLYADQDLGLFENCLDRNCRSGMQCFNEAQYSIWSRPR
jgi:hypothetical protein